jgi:hypothetical protein
MGLISETDGALSGAPGGPASVDNDPSRQPRLSSRNYSFGKRRERYRGFESSSLRQGVLDVEFAACRLAERESWAYSAPWRCSLANDFRPKKSGPDQRTPVIFRAISESERNRSPWKSKPSSSTVTR